MVAVLLISLTRPGALCIGLSVTFMVIVNCGLSLSSKRTFQQYSHALGCSPRWKTHCHQNRLSVLTIQHRVLSFCRDIDDQGLLFLTSRNAKDSKNCSWVLWDQTHKVLKIPFRCVDSLRIMERQALCATTQMRKDVIRYQQKLIFAARSVRADSMYNRGNGSFAYGTN